jgi:hypothetical protein
VANQPDYIVVSRDRDLRGRRGEVWVRRGVAGLLSVIPLLALFEGNLRRERMTHEEIAEEARQQQIDSIEKVKWAILESSGKISFIT